MILLCHNLTGERCSLCDYDLCCVCSKPLNTLKSPSSLLLQTVPHSDPSPVPGPALVPPHHIVMSQSGPAPAHSFPRHLPLSGPLLPPPPLLDTLHTGPALVPAYSAPTRNLFYMFDLQRSGFLATDPVLPPPLAPVPSLPPPSLKMFPIFNTHKINPPPPPVRPLLLKFIQNPNDPMLLYLPVWKPTVQPVPRGSRMKIGGLRRSMTPHVLKPLPSLSHSLNSSLVLVEECD